MKTNSASMSAQINRSVHAGQCRSY